MAVQLNDLFTKHRATIDEAVNAIHSRHFYAHWPEVPSGKIYGETAMKDGEEAFKAMVGKPFEALQRSKEDEWYGTEESPYGFPLNITYPLQDPDDTVEYAQRAFRPWARLTPEERAGVLMEALERSAQNFFALAFATMHTTGQGFIMAFQASGPHAYDRALEALALGWYEQKRYSDTVVWEKPMGKMSVKLEKKFRPFGKGVSLAIGCSTFPVWNTLPSVFASLVTGNTVIVKPHPKAVLPMAMVVADVRATLKEYGVNPDTIQLAVDGERLITKELAEHNDVPLIDYTGGTAFGDYLEGLHGKIVFTEKAGVNSVILDSVDNLDAALENIAFSLSLYSGQMCTTPQNIFVPEAGVGTPDGIVSYHDIVEKLKEKITALTGNEKMGPGTLGAIQNTTTMDRIKEAEALGFEVTLPSTQVTQPGFDAARTWTPMILEVPAKNGETYTREMFGPISMIVQTMNTDESIQIAAMVAKTAGAITFAAYTTDEWVMAKIEEELAFAGAPISFNLVGPIWVNQSATFSDFHVTGGNPSGNASLTDVAFVTRRFYTVGIRKPVKE